MLLVVPMTARLVRGGNNNMYAVIETGGKQYRVTEGDVITVEKLKTDAGKKVIFDKVLVMGDGKDAEVGTPYLDAAKVYGEVIENGKGSKVIIFKYKAKKDYRKKQGHRQPFSMVEITGINTDKPRKVKPAAEKAAEPAAAEKKKPAQKKAAEKSSTKSPTGKGTSNMKPKTEEMKKADTEAKKVAPEKTADSKPVKAEKKTPSLKSMKKDELIAFAKEHNIDVDEKATKAVIIESIETNLK